jgi:hypothetical protein
MAERLEPRLRPTGMWMRVLGTLVVAPLVVTGCGDEKPVADDGRGQFASPVCPSTPASTVEVGRVDLDGDGAPDPIGYVASTAQCAASLTATVGGRDGAVVLDDDLAVRPGTSFGISVPGRDGDIAVVRQEHPRGGFQVVLLAWSAGSGLSTLNVDNRPVFPFVATDTESTPLSARCVDGGFVLTQARRHEPIGVAPAWDVDETRYTLNGTSTTAGPTEEIADNVLEKDFRMKYRALTSYSLFANCRAAG